MTKKDYIILAELISKMYQHINATVNVSVDEDGFIPFTALAGYNQSILDILLDLKSGGIPTIDAYTLSYNMDKNLVETPTDPIGINLKKYLNQ